MLKKSKSNVPENIRYHPSFDLDFLRLFLVSINPQIMKAKTQIIGVAVDFNNSNMF